MGEGGSLPSWGQGRAVRVILFSNADRGLRRRCALAAAAASITVSVPAEQLV